MAVAGVVRVEFEARIADPMAHPFTYIPAVRSKIDPYEVLAMLAFHASTSYRITFLATVPSMRMSLALPVRLVLTLGR